MLKIKWEHPLIGCNANFMGMAWGMAIPMTIMEDQMKKYFPFQYQMLKDMQAAMEQGR